jgi:hypothetical protein
MNLSLAILEIYPHINLSEDFTIRYDYDNARFVINEWNIDEVEPTLEELDSAWLNYVRKEKISDLNNLCDEFIVSGFVSPSTQFEFEFAIHDQNNFAQQAIILMNDITVPNVAWKTKNQGIQSLTREQFFQILKESEAHKRYGIERYWTLKAQVELAITEEEIRNINW